MHLRRLLARPMVFTLAILISGPMGALAQGGPPRQVSVIDTDPVRPLDAPADTRPTKEKFWLSEDWYKNGTLETVANHELESRMLTYFNPADNTEVQALLVRPKTPGRYPAVLFGHGRRGYDELVARRLAARGLVVLLPDLYAARFIETFPVAHKAETEADLDAAVDVLLRQPDVSASRICLVSLSRGGYYTLKVAVTRGRQDRHIACYVGYYPHWQDPAAPEPDQVYRYATEVDRLVIPTLLFAGEHEQYQRRRSIESAVAAMKERGRDVRLIIYPAVGRGFDFRPPEVRTFADDLAAKDANQRTAAFVTRHLKPWKKASE